MPIVVGCFVDVKLSQDFGQSDFSACHLTLSTNGLDEEIRDPSVVKLRDGGDGPVQTWFKHSANGVDDCAFNGIDRILFHKILYLNVLHAGIRRYEKQ